MRFSHGRPNGGDGGTGGSIVLKASKDMHTLLDLQMRKTFNAEDGRHGGSNHMNGRVGADYVVNVPIGTQVIDEATGFLMSDLTREGDTVKVAVGGAGGKGNHKHANSTEGEKGEERMVRLELKLMADVGLVGFPNAGKSTLISHVTSAKSRIAAFPFTTKEPVLGVVKTQYGDSFVIADIPGLIEGASEGRGMGHQFLKHIERTQMLVMLIDMAGTDGRDPVQDYQILQAELADYSQELAKKPRIVAANKMDVPEAAANLKKFKKKIKLEVMEISAATGQGLPELVAKLFGLVHPKIS